MDFAQKMLDLRERLLIQRADLLAQLSRIDKALGTTIMEDVPTIPVCEGRGLTRRQGLALSIIGESITRLGFPPTLREIGIRMGIRSTNGVNDHLEALERKGFITRQQMTSRAIRLTDKGKAYLAPTEEAV